MSTLQAASLPVQAIRRLGASESGLAIVALVGFVLLPVFVSGYPIYILPQYMLFGVMAMSLALLWGFGGILAVLGYFLFRAGVRAAYFVLVTLAISIIVEQVAVSQSQWTGGWNGMYIPRMSLTLGSVAEISLFDDAPMYYVVLTIVAVTYGLLRWLLAGKFGKVLIGIRENEDRVISLGFDTSLYKTTVFMISGALAAFAGALYGTHAGFVSPSLGGVLFSTEVVVWVAIGGRSSLLGALLAAIVVAWLSNYLSALVPKYWQLVIGVIFVAVIIYFKGGVAGAFARHGARSNAGNGANG
jgi:urea ABC transporter permease protein UrtC